MEQFRAQPAFHSVTGSFILSARSHDQLENSNCSPSPGQLRLMNINFFDFESELLCSSFSVAGRHLLSLLEHFAGIQFRLFDFLIIQLERFDECLGEKLLDIWI